MERDGMKREGLSTLWERLIYASDPLHSTRLDEHLRLTHWRMKSLVDTSTTRCAQPGGGVSDVNRSS